MTVEVTEHGSSIVVEISGELDLFTAPAFRERVDRALSADGPRNLVLELSQLSFVDSSGLGAILGRYKVVTQLGGRMILVCPQPQVQRIFALSGLFKIMDPAQNVDQALQMVQGG
jgi:stage II sporulation protein AA (anti-sigma F factor antagonist)